MWRLLPILCCIGLITAPLSVRAADAEDQNQANLDALVQILQSTDDPQFQLDILTGLSQALQGRRQVEMPEGWRELEPKLLESSKAEVRSLTRSLSLKFGSSRAMKQLRQTLQDPSADPQTRRQALESLVSAHDPDLPDILHSLLQDPALRGPALQALAAYSHPDTPEAILPVYDSLNTAEKRDALNTLSSRVSFAKTLLTAIDQERVPASDLTADLVRQLRNLNEPVITAKLESVWGVARETSAEKEEMIAEYKSMLQSPDGPEGDPTQGRLLFARVCQQCHQLFGQGGEVGPDLTGSNRRDLDYILQNMVDPNAVIPNDYRASTLETTDGRVLTGIVRQQTPNSVTITTPNQNVVVPREEIDSLRQNELSMMPEGLLQALTKQQVRDLVAYLGQPAQVPLPAAIDTLHYFFNGEDLTNWEGDPDLWRVENGEIVGKTDTGLDHNEFLVSQMLLSDFRLVCEVKLTPNQGNSGIQFRSRLTEDGNVHGYQADIGAGWWGKLYEEHGRALLWEKSGEQYVKAGEWNRYEIVAVGDRIRTAINGHPCVELNDPEGAEKGFIAFQLHAGGPMEVRFRNLQLELDPNPELTQH